MSMDIQWATSVKKTNLEKFLKQGVKNPQLKKFKAGSLRTNSQIKKPFVKPKRKGDTHHAGSRKKKVSASQSNFKNKKSKKLLIQTEFDQEEEKEEEEQQPEEPAPILNPLGYGQNISFANNRISNETPPQVDYNIYMNSKK